MWRARYAWLSPKIYIPRTRGWWLWIDEVDRRNDYGSCKPGLLFAFTGLLPTLVLATAAIFFPLYYLK